MAPSEDGDEEIEDTVECCAAPEEQEEGEHTHAQLVAALSPHSMHAQGTSTSVADIRSPTPAHPPNHDAAPPATTTSQPSAQTSRRGTAGGSGAGGVSSAPPAHDGGFSPEELKRLIQHVSEKYLEVDTEADESGISPGAVAASGHTVLSGQTSVVVGAPALPASHKADAPTGLPSASDSDNAQEAGEEEEEEEDLGYSEDEDSGVDVGVPMDSGEAPAAAGPPVVRLFTVPAAGFNARSHSVSGSPGSQQSPAAAPTPAPTGPTATTEATGASSSVAGSAAAVDATGKGAGEGPLSVRTVLGRYVEAEVDSPSEPGGGGTWRSGASGAPSLRPDHASSNSGTSVTDSQSCTSQAAAGSNTTSNSSSGAGTETETSATGGGAAAGPTDVLQSPQATDPLMGTLRGPQRVSMATLKAMALAEEAKQQSHTRKEDTAQAPTSPTPHSWPRHGSSASAAAAAAVAEVDTAAPMSSSLRNASSLPLDFIPPSPFAVPMAQQKASAEPQGKAKAKGSGGGGSAATRKSRGSPPDGGKPLVAQHTEHSALHGFAVNASQPPATMMSPFISAQSAALTARSEKLAAAAAAAAAGHEAKGDSPLLPAWLSHPANSTGPRSPTKRKHHIAGPGLPGAPDTLTDATSSQAAPSASAVTTGIGADEALDALDDFLRDRVIIAPRYPTAVTRSPARKSEKTDADGARTSLTRLPVTGPLSKVAAAVGSHAPGAQGDVETSTNGVEDGEAHASHSRELAAEGSYESGEEEEDGDEEVEEEVEEEDAYEVDDEDEDLDSHTNRITTQEMDALKDELSAQKALAAGLRGELRKYTQLTATLEAQMAEFRQHHSALVATASVHAGGDTLHTAAAVSAAADRPALESMPSVSSTAVKLHSAALAAKAAVATTDSAAPADPGADASAAADSSVTGEGHVADADKDASKSPRGSSSPRAAGLAEALPAQPHPQHLGLEADKRLSLYKEALSCTSMAAGAMREELLAAQEVLKGRETLDSGSEKVILIKLQKIISAGAGATRHLELMQQDAMRRSSPTGAGRHGDSFSGPSGGRELALPPPQFGPPSPPSPPSLLSPSGPDDTLAIAQQRLEQITQLTEENDRLQRELTTLRAQLAPPALVSPFLNRPAAKSASQPTSPLGGAGPASPMLPEGTSAARAASLPTLTLPALPSPTPVILASGPFKRPTDSSVAAQVSTSDVHTTQQPAGGTPAVTELVAAEGVTHPDTPEAVSDTSPSGLRSLEVQGETLDTLDTLVLPASALTSQPTALLAPSALTSQPTALLAPSARATAPAAAAAHNTLPGGHDADALEVQGSSMFAAEMLLQQQQPSATSDSNGEVCSGAGLEATLRPLVAVEQDSSGLSPPASRSGSVTKGGVRSKSSSWQLGGPTAAEEAGWKLERQMLLKTIADLEAQIQALEQQLPNEVADTTEDPPAVIAAVAAAEQPATAALGAASTSTGDLQLQAVAAQLEVQHQQQLAKLLQQHQQQLEQLQDELCASEAARVTANAVLAVQCRAAAAEAAAGRGADNTQPPAQFAPATTEDTSISNSWAVQSQADAAVDQQLEDLNRQLEVAVGRVAALEAELSQVSSRRVALASEVVRLEGLLLAQQAAVTESLQLEAQHRALEEQLVSTQAHAQAQAEQLVLSQQQLRAARAALADKEAQAQAVHERVKAFCDAQQQRQQQGQAASIPAAGSQGPAGLPAPDLVGQLLWWRSRCQQLESQLKTVTPTEHAAVTADTTAPANGSAPAPVAAANPGTEATRLRLATLLQLVAATDAKLKQRRAAEVRGATAAAGVAGASSQAAWPAGSAVAALLDDDVLALPLDMLAKKLEKRVRGVLLAALEARQQQQQAAGPGQLQQPASTASVASTSSRVSLHAQGYAPISSATGMLGGGMGPGLNATPIPPRSANGDAVGVASSAPGSSSPSVVLTPRGAGVSKSPSPPPVVSLSPPPPDLLRDLDTLSVENATLRRQVAEQTASLAQLALQLPGMRYSSPRDGIAGQLGLSPRTAVGPAQGAGGARLPLQFAELYQYQTQQRLGSAAVLGSQ